ncbi:CHAT domain-containing protein [Streptomyces sp. NPDC002867]
MDGHDGAAGWRSAVRGAELDRQGRTAEARQAFLEATAYGDANGPYNLGLLAERAGRIDEARDWYARAHDAGHPEAANNLGVLLYNAGDPAAERWFAAAAAAGHEQAAANLERLRFRPGADGPVEDPVVLRAVAVAAFRAFELTGDDAALVRTVNVHREAVRAAPPGHPLRGTLQGELRDLLAHRYDLRGHMADLEEAAAVAVTVWSDLAPDHPDRCGAARPAVALLRRRFEATGEAAWAKEAVGIGRETLERPGAGAGARERAELESALCAVLSTLAHFRADMEAGADSETENGAEWDAGRILDEAVAWGRAAVERFPDVVGRINCGMALLVRGGRRGSVEDLGAAVVLLRTAYAEADEPHHRIAAATNLATALRGRADLTGRGADAQAAREAARAARRAQEEQQTQAPHVAGQAEALVQSAYTVEGDGTSAAVRRALSALPEGHTAQSVLLLRLAAALLESEDRDGAVQAARQAVAAAEGTGPVVEAQRTLGRLLLGTEEDDDRRDAAVAEAVEAFTTAAALCDESAMVYAEVMTGLAGALIARCLLAEAARDSAQDSAQGEAKGGEKGAAPDRVAALAAVRAAAGAPGSPVRDRLVAARIWAGVAWEGGDVADALAGARAGVALLQEFGWAGLDRDDQQQGLRDGAALPRDAAAIAIAAGRPDVAVELLEQGRSVIWRGTLHLRADLDRLAARDTALAAGLAEVRDALTDGGHRDAEERMRLVLRWRRLVDRVRSLPGFERFLAPPRFAQLAAAAAGGPVVVVNISAIRCDAIVVLPGGRVEVVPLTGIDLAGTDRVVNTYLAHLSEAASSGGLARERARHTVHNTLEWLWERIARPVLDRLGLPYKTTSPPRLWWCPTASLVILPLHAAGKYPRSLHDRTEPAGLPYAVVSSYTSTLSALAEAAGGRPSPDPGSRPWKGRWRAGARRSRSAGLLAVGLSDTRRGHTVLPDVAEELRAVREAAGRRVKVLSGDAATVRAVRAQLPRHTWVHFACHGTLDMTAPTTSGLCLRDGDMNVTDFSELRLDDAELAFVSACHTRLGSGQLPDEAIHTAAALRTAGFRHVVAALWSVPDRVAPVVAAAFYRHLADTDAAGAAVALHRAVAVLREAHPTDPALWAPFVHDGP